MCILIPVDLLRESLLKLNHLNELFLRNKPNVLINLHAHDECSTLCIQQQTELFIPNKGVQFCSVQKTHEANLI